MKIVYGLSIKSSILYNYHNILTVDNHILLYHWLLCGNFCILGSLNRIVIIWII